MELPQDFNDLLKFFAERKVEYLLVGGYAFAIHAYPRTTGDIDLFIRITPENAEKILAALNDFGFGAVNLKAQDFLTPGMVIQLGVEPFRVDLLTSIEGVTWEEADQNKIIVVSDSGVSLPVIGKNELIRNKLSTGREKDLLDVKKIRELEEK
ncbi:hypothetical protein SDC9_134790 [bioreactor metagenome]|uniref:Uncharacterized protein n=1 Tax=bioreactor metagenome TaxID=1076179 RepID=A0A645DDX5_9ZZZZ